MILSSSLIIDPLLPVWLTLVVGGALLILLLWKEFRSGNRFLAARLIAAVLLAVSIFGILLRPSATASKISSGVILLTPHYRTESVDSLLKLNPSLTVAVFANAVPYPNATTIQSENDLLPFASRIHFIAGDGVSSDILSLITNSDFRFIKGTSSRGVSSLAYNQSVIVNQNSMITGTISIDKKSTLTITGNGAKDSINFDKEGIHSFRFKIKPSQPGLFLYSLKFNNEPAGNIPLEVIPEKKLKIIILQKFPTAETRILKNFLSERGHSIALRYQTSKSNFNYEFSNTPSIKIDRLTGPLLETVDLIFMDGIVASELSSSERDILIKAVSEGLGVIYFDTPDKDKTIDRLLPFRFKQEKRDTVHITVNDSKQYALSVQPKSISAGDRVQTIVSHRNTVLSGYNHFGAGKAGFQLLRETYRIKLEGNEDDYSSIWSPLIQQVTRRQSQSFKIRLKEEFPYFENQSINIEVISTGARPDLYDQNSHLPLTEDVSIDDVWTSGTWAGKPGWHHFQIKNDSARLNYFVSGNDEWQTLQQDKNTKLTRLAGSRVSAADENVTEIITHEISPLIFYLIFLVAAGFLWLSPKL